MRGGVTEDAAAGTATRSCSATEMADIDASAPLAINIVVSLITKVLISMGNVISVAVIIFVRYLRDFRASSSESGGSGRPVA